MTLIIIAMVLSNFGFDESWAFHFTDAVMGLIVIELIAETVWFLVTEIER